MTPKQRALSKIKESSCQLYIVLEAYSGIEKQSWFTQFPPCFNGFEGATGTSLKEASWLVFRQIWLVPAKRKKIHVLSTDDDKVKRLFETKIIPRRMRKKFSAMNIY